MARYIAIAHHWFVDSNGFTVEQLDATSPEDAQEMAHAIQRRLHSTFNKTAVQLIHIGDKALLSPRRLTLWERLSGRLASPPSQSTAMKKGE